MKLDEILPHALIATVSVFAPIKATLITVMVLSVVDLIAGIQASKKRRRKITSTGLKRTIVKVAVYELVVLLGFLTEQYMTGETIPIVKVITGYIGLTELVSIMENIEIVTGVPVIKAITKKIEALRRD